MMFMVQQMLALLEEGAKPNNQTALAQLGMLSGWEQNANLFRDVLDNYELYAFDRSALIPASDIRTDTERGLLGIAQHVTKTPRLLFIESSQADLEATMPQFGWDEETSDSQLREGSREAPEGFGIIEHRGCVIDIQGNGHCTIQTINRSRITSPDRKRLMREGLSAGEARFAHSVLQLTASTAQIRVDMNKPLTVSREEFMASQPEELSQREREARWAKHQVDTKFWGEVSDTARNTVYANGYRPLEDHMVEVNGIYQAGIAMAAVLELKDTEKTPRPVILPQKMISGYRRKSRAPSAELQGSGKRSISVVTMHLDEEILISMRTEAEREASRSTGKGTGSPRALHYVRGHMFLARNGQIVYRKPHFRGQAGLRKLNRVVA